MKKIWLVVIILVIVLLGYLGRRQIKSMLGLSSQPAQTTSIFPTPTSTSSNVPSDNIYLTKTDTAKGPYLTDFAGKTLYVFDKDTNGVSNCYGSCATTWPPYTSGATAQSTFPTNITIIKRTDGITQFAWKGMPLYYYSKDVKPGDITGDGVGGIWHIVKP